MATIELHEPSPYQGKYVVTYGWHVSATRAMAPASASATGASSEALSAAGVAPVPYPRPFRSFRFARPMAKRSTAKPPPKVKMPLPKWWVPTPLRLFTKQPKQPRPPKPTRQPKSATAAPPARAASPTGSQP
jgi:hypothetical protein